MLRLTCERAELFEHVRNHEQLMARIASWLRPGGKLFVHVFSNREVAYPFDDGAEWHVSHHRFARR